MISLLLAVILTVSGTAATTDEVPNCESCDYNNGIGFVKSMNVCAGYFVCSKNQVGGYFYEFMCCPRGQTFDVEHLTCTADESSQVWVAQPLQCNTSRNLCPYISFVDICKLHRDQGPCLGHSIRYFFNSSSKQCETFVYGLCGGNANNFETLLDCQNTCVKHICDMPKEVGHCYANWRRYFYNSITRRCEPFTFGGCWGNANNFETWLECQKTCVYGQRSNCLYNAYEPDNHYFVMPGGKVVSCPMSEVWDQEVCSCVRGPSFVPNDDCCKILHFEFNGTYDSYSCYNFAKGEPQNYPSVDNNVLCLDGNKSQSVAVPFLDNWFAWNPIGKTFTICFWLCPKYANQTSGVFSTNCEHGEKGSASVLEVCLKNGELVLYLGDGTPVFLWKFPPTYKFSKLCITFENGIYKVYLNGWLCGVYHRDLMPPNSHSATSLGYVYGKPYFSGYIDDFCFWTKVLPYDKIKKCFDKGPSNNYKQRVG